MPVGKRSQLLLLRDAFTDPPWLDTAVSRVLLEAAAVEQQCDSLRLFRPAAVVAFGPADRTRPGYRRAWRAAVEAGFTPIERTVGGHAAVYHADTIALCWTVRDVDARSRIRERYEVLSTLVADALRRLGLDARIGEVGGEYCPGAYSINAGGRTKVAGFGQRVTSGAAHVAGVIVADGADRVRSALGPVYEALELHWDPATASSLRAEGVDADWEEVAATVIEEFAARFNLVPGSVPPTLLERARALISTLEVAVD